MGICLKLPGGASLSYYRPNGCFEEGLTLLNKGYILINVLKALASIVSMCSLHVIFYSKITPRYFTLITKGVFRPLNVKETQVVGVLPILCSSLRTQPSLPSVSYRQVTSAKRTG
jgi:hypothetical protein